VTCETYGRKPLKANSSFTNVALGDAGLGHEPMSPRRSTNGYPCIELLPQSFRLLRSFAISIAVIVMISESP